MNKQDKMYITHVIGERLVTPQVRVFDPADCFLKEPNVYVTFAFQNPMIDVPVLPYDFKQRVQIRQRTLYWSVEEALQNFASIERNRYVGIAELDDLIPSLAGETAVKSDLLSYMGMQAVQVSTKPLAEIIRPLNPYVKVFPNQLASLPKERNYEAERKNKIKNCGRDYLIFFFGALNRNSEWQDIMPALRDVIADYGSMIRFKVISDWEFYSELPTPYKEFIGDRNDQYKGRFVSYDVYSEALHTADVAFLPLHDTPFNRCKTDLKFIESAGHGAVVIASPTVYEGVVRDGETGLIYRNPQQFKECLSAMIMNHEQRINMARAAYDYVRGERLLSQHYMERLDWYRELCGRREELTQAAKIRTQILLNM